MWATLRSSKINKDGKKLKETRKKSLNVNEEYSSALRTKSYADFFTKAQLILVKDYPSNTPSFCYRKFSDILLEPGQEATITAILESPILSKNPDLKTLMLKYFDISAEASKTCSQLLKKINRVQTNYGFIQRALETIEYNYSHEQYDSVISELSSFVDLKNPFSNPNKHDFKVIHDEYSSLLHHLKSKKKKVAKKIKMIKYFKKATGICVTAACSLVAITAMIIATHTLTALLMGPAIFSFPFKSLKKKILSVGLFKSGILKKVGEHLDVAAKGTYILDRDFDTMSRLVARVYDEVEHNKGMIQFCLERKEEDRFSWVEAIVKELKKSEIGFRKQVEELEEHVYLCLVTINRARGLVVREMTTSCV